MANSSFKHHAEYPKHAFKHHAKYPKHEICGDI